MAARLLTVLTRDGDQIGQWLRGERNPTLRQAIHPRMAQYFHHIGASDHLRAAAGWAGAACSDLRGSHEFRMCITPWIVKRHQGELIYAGGDDVLALLPTETAIVCAEELQRAFRGIHGDGTPG